jgi:hypothetical protein
MSSPRLRGLSTRVSEAVYTALCARAKAEGVTLSTLAARLLEAAPETLPTDVEARPEEDATHHGWGSGDAEGGLAFLLPTPEVVKCPGCGAEGRHLWLCWDCGLYLLAEECTGQGSCAAGWPLEQFQIERDDDRHSHTPPPAIPIAER